jgi:hypothetical protein
LSLIIDKIRESVKQYTPIETEIELGQLGEDVGGLGAVAYAFQKLKGLMNEQD